MVPQWGAGTVQTNNARRRQSEALSSVVPETDLQSRGWYRGSAST